MNNLWNYLNGLSLSRSDREWLAEKLIEPTKAEQKENVAEKPKRRRKVRPLSPEVAFLSNLHIKEFSQEELDADPRLAAIIEDRRPRE